MMLLSAMPCSDEVENILTSQTTFQSVSAQQSSGDEESCSPACLCVCCGQRVIAPLENQLPVNIAFEEIKKQVLFEGAKPEQRQNAIWNPPKMA